MEILASHTWWIDVKKRTWVILAVPFTPYYNEKNVMCFKPSGLVDLLELGKTAVVQQPHEIIQEYVNNGTFKPLNIY